MKIGNEKTAWQKYGKWVLTAMVGFLLIYSGIQYYDSYQDKKVVKASAAYDKIIFALQSQDKTKAITEAKELMEHFARTPYSSLAALLLARLAVEENDLTTAKEHLNFALQNGVDPFKQIAKERLARVLAEEKDYEAALSLLNKEPIPEAYKTLLEGTKGDIYLMQNNKDEARKAYQLAISAAPSEVPIAHLQLKLADLGVKGGS